MAEIELLISSEFNYLAVAECSIDRSYQLFRDQPYLQQLIPLVNQSDFAEVVKAIALHAGYANVIPQPNP